MNLKELDLGKNNITAAGTRWHVYVYLYLGNFGGKQYPAGVEFEMKP